MATQADINALLEEAKCYAAAGAGSLVNLVKLGLLSNIAGGGGCAVPDPPVMLGPDPADDPNYDLNWTASAGATGYLWDLGEPPNFAFYIFQDEPAPLPGVFVADVDNASRMCRVRAVNACGISDYSNTVNFFTVAVPDAPVAIAAGSVLFTSFVANWTAPAQAVSSYSIDVSTDPLFGSFVGAYNNLNVGLTLFATISGLTPETTYYYRIRAVNIAGTSANSNVISTVATISGLEYWSRSDMGVYTDAAKASPATDGTLVYTWDNMGNTGTTPDFIQATAGLRPIYREAGVICSLPRLSFNVSMMRALISAHAQPFSIVLVGTYAGQIGAYAAWVWTDTASVQLTAQSVDVAPYFNVGTYKQPLTPWRSFIGYEIAVADGASSYFSVNGVDQGAFNCGANTVANAGITIGGANSGVGSDIIGDYFEFMFFNKALSIAEKASLNAYLTARYLTPEPLRMSSDDFADYVAGLNLNGLNGVGNWNSVYASRP